MKMHIKIRQINTGLLAIGMFFCGATHAQVAPYRFSDLGHGAAFAINSYGQVAGASFSANGPSRATIWNGTVATDLGTLGGTYSYAQAINNKGQVAGYAATAGDIAIHATVWNGASATDLGTLGGLHSVASGINDHGQVTGWAYTASTTAGHATIWNGTTATDLDTQGMSGASSGTAINNVGQIVGDFRTISFTSIRATVWSGTSPTFLDSLGGSNSMASAINDQGQIVGAISTFNGESRAILWSGTVASDLSVSGAVASQASAINNKGQVVGYFTSSGSAFAHAFLWNGTSATDLNNLLDANTVDAGWVLEYATGINDNGSIVGQAYNVKTGAQDAFLLSVNPVPEPEAYSMLLAGIGLMGLLAGRRKKTHSTADNGQQS